MTEDMVKEMIYSWSYNFRATRWAVRNANELAAECVADLGELEDNDAGRGEIAAWLRAHDVEATDQNTRLELS